MMRQELRMPALGQTTDELTVLKWWKAVGDFVGQGELLLEVETDKATLEVESALEGTILELLCDAGDVVTTGTPIAIIGEEAEGEAPETIAEPTNTESQQTTAPRSPQQPVPIPVASTSGVQVPNKLPPLPPLPPENAQKRVIARPTARYLARLHGIQLAQIQGTGTNGLIERRDVQAEIDKRISRAVTAAKTGQKLLMASNEEAVEYSVPAHRLKVAAQVTESAQKIPQIQLSMTVNMDRALNLIEANRQNGLQQLKVTHLILQAMSQALAHYPQLNTLWIDGDQPTYRQLGTKHVGLAVAQGDQLQVISIPEPDSLSLPTLVETTTSAIGRARDGRLNASDLQPTAITLSNLGMYGIDHFIALVEPGKTAILAVGKMVEVAQPERNGFRFITQLNVTLSVDHRVVDGRLAALYLGKIRDHLQGI